VRDVLCIFRRMSTYCNAHEPPNLAEPPRAVSNNGVDNRVVLSLPTWVPIADKCILKYNSNRKKCPNGHASKKIRLCIFLSVAPGAASLLTGHRSTPICSTHPIGTVRHYGRTPGIPTSPRILLQALQIRISHLQMDNLNQSNKNRNHDTLFARGRGGQPGHFSEGGGSRVEGNLDTFHPQIDTRAACMDARTKPRKNVPQQRTWRLLLLLEWRPRFSYDFRRAHCCNRCRPPGHPQRVISNKRQPTAGAETQKQLLESSGAPSLRTNLPKMAPSEHSRR